jgi:hypothetical protein
MLSYSKYSLEDTGEMGRVTRKTWWVAPLSFVLIIILCAVAYTAMLAFMTWMTNWFLWQLAQDHTLPAVYKVSWQEMCMAIIIAWCFKWWCTIKFEFNKNKSEVAVQVGRK